MEYGKGGKHQEIRMVNRKALEISGVSNVDSFDSEEFLLETACGFLAVRGQDLQMKSLSLEQGQVSIEGQIHSLIYLDGAGAKSKGLLGKLFR